MRRVLLMTTILAAVVILGPQSDVTKVTDFNPVGIPKKSQSIRAPGG